MIQIEQVETNKVNVRGESIWNKREELRDYLEFFRFNVILDEESESIQIERGAGFRSQMGVEVFLILDPLFEEEIELIDNTEVKEAREAHII